MVEAPTPDIERFITRYSIGRDANPSNTTGSLHFLRIKVPGGLITSQQLRGVAELATIYGKGLADVSDREDIQLHWIRAEDSLEIFATMDKLGFTTDMCGQSFSGASHGDVRNIICCPTSGIERGEIINGYPIAEKLTKFFVGNPNFLDLPRKFKISISGCGTNCTRAEINDLAFVGVKKGDEVGFTLLVGGGMGVSLPGPRLARPTGVFVRPNDVFAVAVAAAKIHRDYGNREIKAKARLKWLIESWGLEKFLTLLEEKSRVAFEKYDGPTFLKHDNHVGVQPQAQEGYYYVSIPRVGGRFTSHELVLIADLAEEYGSGELRLTPTQKIIISYVGKKDALLTHLEEMKFSFNGSKLRWNSIACPSDFCGKSYGPHGKEILREVIDHLEEHFASRVLDEADFRIHVNGCPHNCCACTIAEIGLTSRLIREGDEVKQAYDLFLGGHFGSEASFGRIVEEKILANTLKHKIAFLLHSYLNKRNTSESLGEFCNRHTIEELKTYLNTAEE